MSKVSERVATCVIVIVLFLIPWGGYMWFESCNSKRHETAIPKVEKPGKKPLTKEQEDSIRLAKEQLEEKLDKERVVIVMKGDEWYHYCTWCWGVELNKASFTTEYKAKKAGKDCCEECYFDRHNKESIETGDFDNIVSNYDFYEFIREYYD